MMDFAEVRTAAIKCLEALEAEKSEFVLFVLHHNKIEIHAAASPLTYSLAGAACLKRGAGPV
jgi:hypothetical protein